MALRDKLRSRVQPHLEAGEQVRAVVPCSTGANPVAFAFLGGLVMLLVNKYWLLVATDRGLVVLKAGKFTGTSPKGVERRLPPGTTLDVAKGTIWGKTPVLGKTAYVHRRFWPDADQADAAARAGSVGGAGAAAVAAATGATPAGWYPDPHDASRQRWWDGSAWTENVHPSG